MTVLNKNIWVLCCVSVLYSGFLSCIPRVTIIHTQRFENKVYFPQYSPLIIPDLTIIALRRNDEGQTEERGRNKKSSRENKYEVR